MSGKRLALRDVPPGGYYPHSLETLSCGEADTDVVLGGNSYAAMQYERPVIGKYVVDPDAADISNPRYAGPLVPPRLSGMRPATGNSNTGPVRPPGGGRSASTDDFSPYLVGRPVIGFRPPAHPRKAMRREEEANDDDDDDEDDAPVSSPHRPASRKTASSRNDLLAVCSAQASVDNPNMEKQGVEELGPRQHPPITYRLIKSAAGPSISSLFFPIHYGPSTPKDRLDPRGLPEEINRRLHGDDEAGLCFTQVEANGDNLNRLCLYKVGPGSVAFRVVVQALEASGMKCTTSNENFNLLWAKRATPHILAVLKPYQKINHFPGTWGIGRKDSLARNITRMKRQFGSAAFNIVPPSFILPGDETALREDVDTQTAALGTVPTYIVKPAASSCGKGIKLYRGMPPAVPTGKGSHVFVCQRYVADPLLVQDRKFDLRMYCVATSFDPLRLFLFDQGLVRFAAEKYRGPEKDLDNIHMHLTNYSVNKTAELSRASRGKGFESDDPVDIKWCLSDLRQHLETLHGNANASRMWDTIKASIKDVVIKTFVSIEADVTAKMRSECLDPSGRGCFELYGLDLMITKELQVYLIEVNIMPSLATGSTLDKAVKSRMLAHMLRLARVVPYDRRKQQMLPTPMPAGPEPTGDRYVYPRERGAPRARENRTNVPLLKKFDDPNVAESMLAPHETLMLMESEEELRCAGGFERIFPTPATAEKYFPLFSQGVSRSNYLLASWVAQKERASK
jgi:tubulin polyglutamylase TTLL4